MLASGGSPARCQMSAKSPRPLSLRGIRAMDLDFARRLHAKEVCQVRVSWDVFRGCLLRAETIGENM